MRLRNIPRADGVIDAHRAVIKKPEEQRGQWAQVFGNEKPIQIEIGMGKGQFILNMAKAHPRKRHFLCRQKEQKSILECVGIFADDVIYYVID